MERSLELFPPSRRRASGLFVFHIDIDTKQGNKILRVFRSFYESDSESSKSDDKLEENTSLSPTDTARAIASNDFSARIDKSMENGEDISNNLSSVGLVGTAHST